MAQVKVIEDTPDRLVIELRPTGLLVLCVGMFALFFVLGFGMNSFLPLVIGMLGLPGTETLDNLPQVPGMTFLGIASFVPLTVAILFLRTRRLDFNRTTGTLVVNSRQLIGQGERTYPLSTVAGAVLLTNRAQDGRVAHRAALKFVGSQGIVPMTPYYTAGNGPERTVHAVNAWLADQSGQAGPPGTV